MLRDVSLEIGRTEVVAIVGSNGSGKTTLAKILCGLYEPTSGQVLWDGVDVASFEPTSLRRRHRGCVPGLRALRPERRG